MPTIFENSKKTNKKNDNSPPIKKGGTNTLGQPIFPVNIFTTAPIFTDALG